MLAIFVALLVGLLIALAGLAASARNTVEGTLAAGASAALVAFIVGLSAAQFQEGLISVPLWTLVGLGLAPLVRSRSAPQQPPREPASAASAQNAGLSPPAEVWLPNPRSTESSG